MRHKGEGSSKLWLTPECAQVINLIQEQHQYSVKSNFIQIEAMTHPLSEQQKAD